ncbi:MAG: alpha/beta hydrolase [Chitinophagales bacterium]|nr:alpha/beta hydrolase [Chitinophagales bacterium]
MPKETIVFVHGAWHGAWCWEAFFIPFFKKQGFNCYTYNILKHDKPGDTKGINALSIANYVEQLEEIMIPFNNKAIIIAHSMGGLIVQKYLEKHPCKKVILLTPVPYYGVINTTLRFFTKKLYSYPALLSFNLYKLVNTEPKASWAFFSKQIPLEKRLEYSQKLCSESFKAFLNMLFPNIKINYHTKIPMLIIAAENDVIFHVKEERKTAAYYNADFALIPNTAHDVMLDTNYQAVLDKMMEWLSHTD